MAGHLFILRGNLKRMQCDAWLLPAGRSLRVEEYWLDAIPWAHRDERGRVVLENIPADWIEGDLRSFASPHEPPPGEGWPWLTNVGYRGERHLGQGVAEGVVQWFTEGLLAFIRGWLGDPTPRRTQRKLPLLAMPLVGSGRGGGQMMEGRLVHSHVKALLAVAAEHEVDLALVTYSEQAFTAAQEARKKLGGAWALSEAHRGLATGLAERGQQGDLVLFLGAGVSRGAGLPDWQGLLVEMMEQAGLTPEEAGATRELSVLDQARIVQRRLARSGRDLGPALVDRFKVEHYGLVHGLLSSLSVRETVTTNYDPLFETASRACGHEVAVLPYNPVSGCSRWLLKLHGCVHHPEDIVLTREDYMRYSSNRAALAGIVQTLLLTKHMLFVGFSLQDDNFLRIVDDVRRALRRGGTFGTALLLRCDPILRELWEGELELASLGEPDEDSLEVARRLEIFLDYLLSEATSHTSYLLRPNFEGALSKSEQALRESLLEWLERLPDTARQAPAFSQLEKALEQLGYRPER